MSIRHDFYAPIHKGLRFGAARFLTRLGAGDWGDAAASRALLGELREFLELARAHLAHEDEELAPHLLACAPELARGLDHDHTDHEALFAGLDQRIAEVEASGDTRRVAAGGALYASFAAYMAEDITHMAREEQEAMPEFQRHFTDAELEEMEARIIRAIPLPQMLAYFRLMLPASSPAERTALLRHVQKGAPPEIFALILREAAEPSLEPRDWRRLRAEFPLESHAAA